NPVMVNLLFDSELFEAIPPSATAPKVFTIRASDPLVEAGTYYDTILVSAINAINSPQTVFVKTVVRDGTIPPRIQLESTELVFNLKAGSPPPVPILFPILNRFGGCMEWEIVEDVPWMSASRLSGNVPGETILGFDIGGFGCGSYTDSFLVVAPSASNSPVKVSLKLNIWNSRGDCNFNCKVNIADVVYLTNYLFYGGPLPRPEWKIGDVNCNEAVNISDLVYLLVYLFHNGAPPCEEP
ncbi:MAG: dockerin type I repeat-containing protein, partial [candidate division Zixibacteria bacterium]|nr:dockerin type I repeat-containing protein [candidate division Zixibacteria bacterium]